MTDYLLVQWVEEGTHSVVPSKEVVGNDFGQGSIVTVPLKGGSFTAKVLCAGELLSIGFISRLYLQNACKQGFAWPEI